MARLTPCWTWQRAAAAALTSIGLLNSATPDSMHVQLDETGHPECTFQVFLPCDGQAVLKGRMSLLYFL